MKKVLMVASVPSMIGQFNMDNIEILHNLGYKVYVACNFEDRTVWTTERVKQFVKELKEKDICFRQIDFSRNPSDIKNNCKAYKQLKELVSTQEFSFIHCHTPIGGVLSRIAAHKTHTKVIYTAHGFHFFDGAPKKNWVIYYPIEKFFSSWTDVLITINKEDYKRAKKMFFAKRTIYMPGVGIDLGKFRCNKDSHFREKLGIPDNAVLLFSAGELNQNKNHGSVIKALAEILIKIRKKNIYYVIAGQGELKEELQKLINESGLSERVFLLGFRNDIADIYNAADIYILPSLREGLNVSLMEAMASGLPCICGNIRGNVDLIDEMKSSCFADGYTGLGGGIFFDPTSVEDIKDKIGKLLLLSNAERKAMGRYNLQKVRKFDKNIVEKVIFGVYEECGNSAMERTGHA